MLSRAISDEREVLENVYEAEGEPGRVALAPDEPGDVVPLDLADTGRVKVQSGSVLAWTDGLSASRQRDGSVKSTLLGGEGFVTRFEGDGRVWLQTRDPMVFRSQASGE